MPTTAELLTEIGYRFEDSTPKKIPNNLRYEGLNNAQNRLIGLLDESYLTEVTSIDADANISAGYIAFSSIDSSGIFNSGAGILQVYVKPGGSEDSADFAHIYRSIKEYRDAWGSAYTPSDTNIVAYTFNNRLYVKLGTYTSTTADIYYLKKPTPIASGVNPTINESLHHIMMDFAESYFLQNNPALVTKRNADAEKRAMEQVVMLNSKVK